MTTSHTAKLDFGTNTAKSREKLGEVILYLADKCADDRRFGATKLNKLLYFADFDHYRKYGKSITGAKYQKLDRGPAPRHLLVVKNDLKDNNSVLEADVQYGGYRQRRIIAKRKAALSAFTAEEIESIEQAIRDLAGMNAAEVSDLSHGIAWKAAATGEDIPYQAAYLDDRAPSAGDVAWAHSSIQAA